MTMQVGTTRIERKDRRGRTLRPELVQRDRYFDPQPGDALTQRQREAAQLLMEGLTYREIADRMSIDIKTVENHLHYAYMKAGVTRSLAFAVWWLKSANV